MIAIFTLVQRETYFLDKWRRHYYTQLGSDAKLFVLEHYAPTDVLPTAYDPRVTVRLQHQYSYDHRWMRSVVQKYQHFLLMAFDVVIYTAADQLLMLRDGGDLARWLTNFAYSSNHPAAVPQGYDVLQGEDELALAIDPQRPWLANRANWTPSKHTSRPIVTKAPMYWVPQQLRAYNLKAEIMNPELVLVHLHRVDKDLCLKRHRDIAARFWQPEDRDEGPYRHNLIEEPEMLSRWLRSDPDNPTRYATPIPIPAPVREAI